MGLGPLEGEVSRVLEKRRLVACARRGCAKAQRVARSVGEAQAAAGGARGRLRAASILAMAAGAVTSARTVSLEPSAATERRSDAHAKVDVEGALREGTPIEPRARGVELAVEQAIPVGERDRRSARRGGLYDAGRRQGPCRDECVEHEGRAPIARFERLERTRSRRRGRGARRRLRIAVLRSHATFLVASTTVGLSFAS